MTKGDELRKEIDQAGIKIITIADKMNCSRNRIYSILNGADCSGEEIIMFSEILHLSNSRRDYIFLK